ncbi:thioesterase II family protein [Nostoc sp. XA010]|uniref:thioesterase II family protein n=1 Tax=Nostoc sp. XA010 TaxID=2780407 RepID=UPI001E51D3AD|nr:thioesterase II family protein [Nostoc sp. XA010]MCC5661297.1 thioesterase II family protein [Nostoc sp. XA010]
MTATLIHNSWFLSYKPKSQTQLRLFCFPYAGGGAANFSRWSDYLPEIEVCPVQLPGRENRFHEQSFIQLSPLVETLAQVIYPYLDIPFAFFGHSMGALIAFELAQQLRSNYSLSPDHLFVSGRGAPQIPDREPPISQLPESEFIEELRCFNGTPESVLQNMELMQLMLPILRADFALCETYVYSNHKPLDCPISAFGGTEDSQVSHKALMAWQEMTNSRFALSSFPGNHFFINSARNFVLQAIVKDLTKVRNFASSTK